MSSATTNLTTPPPQPPGLPPRSMPTLELLYEMTSKPDERVLFHDVDWSFYEQLLDSIPEGCHIHIDYDGKDLEIMSPGMVHDDARSLLGQFVEALAQTLLIPYKSTGQATWKRPGVKRGLESDESYYFRKEKLNAAAASKARRSDEIADYPNPDLGIEVDMSPPKTDRPGIYAALRVPEVWRFDGSRQEIVIEHLEEDGKYRAVERSSFLPVTAAEIRRWVVEEDSRDESDWARRLRDWASVVVAPRQAGS